MSKIEWTQQTWNPIIGCSKISEGCANCYAERTAARLAQIEKTSYYGDVVQDGKWNGKTALVKSVLEVPLKRQKPTIYFVGSMTDAFHEEHSYSWADLVFAIAALCPQHRFIFLTKRPKIMQRYIAHPESVVRVEHRALFTFDESLVERNLHRKHHLQKWPLPNVILGVTAENQEQADKRIPILLDTPAAARFVSIEPQLEAVDLERLVIGEHYLNVLTGHFSDDPEDWNSDPALDWVICGGESGPGARPMHPDWVRGLRDQCAAAKVPFFFKQWGESVDDLNRQARANANGAFWMLPDGTTGKGQPDPDGCVWMNRVGKKKAGNELDGQLHEEYPEILREVQNG